MIKAIIFDIGGTLINPYKKLRRRHYEKFLRKRGIRVSYKDFWDRVTSVANRTIDIGKLEDEKKFWQMVFDRWKLKISDEDVKRLRDAYLKPRRLYPDVKNHLSKWKGKYKLAIISNAFSPWFYEAFERLGLKRYFEIVIVSSEVGIRKPNKRIFSIALRRLRLRGEEAVYVGNDPHFDIRGAKQSKIKTVILVRNKQTLEKLRKSKSKPDFVIFSLKQLENVLNFYRKIKYQT